MASPSTAIALRSGGDPIQVAERLYKSGLFKDAKDAHQALAKVLAGQEFGLGPVAALSGIFIIDGKLVPSAHVLAGCVKRHPAYDFRVKRAEDGSPLHDNTKCVLTFYERVDGQRVEIGESAFTIEDGKRAGLAGRTNWQRYPRNMLFARALANGVRWFAPDVTATGQVLTYEEAADEAGVDIAPPLASHPEPVAVVNEAQAAPVDVLTLEDAVELNDLYKASGWKGDPKFPSDEHGRLRLALVSVGAVSTGEIGDCMRRLSPGQAEQLRARLTEGQA